MPLYKVCGYVPIAFSIYANNQEEAVDKLEQQAIHACDLAQYVDGMIEIGSVEEVNDAKLVQ